MDKLSLHDPLFATYVIAATLMILKAVSMSWLTVVRMMQVRGGFRSPEDLRKTPLNPDPHARQLEPDERVERIRRIHLNDLENLPFFLVAGFLYVLTEPRCCSHRCCCTGTWRPGCCTSPPTRPQEPMTRAQRCGRSAR